jgi:prepilin-type processing-associated H-X9-DG protein
VILLPHLGRDEVYRRFDLTKAWDDDANRDGVATLVPPLACPSLYRPPAEGAPVTWPYIGVAGVGADAPKLPPTDPRSGFFRYDEPTKTGMVRRGFSRTLTILETTRDPGPWAAGAPPTVRGLDPNDTPYIGPGRQFGAHPAGCNAAFADGSVRFQSNSISPRVLEMLATLAELP